MGTISSFSLLPPTLVGVTSDLFPLVEASLPVCPVATETVHHLWRKQLQQITAITNPPHQHPHNISQVSCAHDFSGLASDRELSH